MRVVMIAFTNIEYTIELTEALTELVDVTLMIPERQAQRFQNKISFNVKMKPFNLPRLRHLRNLLFVIKMFKRINEIKPDLIHIQRGHPWFNFALPFFKRYGLITTIHDVVLHSGDKESTRIPSFTHRIAINYANQIIVHGEKLKDEMIRKYDKSPDDINVLHRGINSIYKRYIEHTAEEGDNTILFFGRIWEYKGLRYLIEAEPLITEKVPDVKIMIAGRGENFQKYQEMIVNKKQFIVYNERIPDKMVAELFQKACIVVLPYTDASQSGIVPLAYAFKKPVVVTNVGSLPEVVEHGETGYIVPPRDSIRLAEAIIDLLKDSGKRKRMGENAYKKANEELSWDGIALKTVEVYKKAISIKN